MTYAIVFLAGIIVALTPSTLAVAWFIRRAKPEPREPVAYDWPGPTSITELTRPRDQAEGLRQMAAERN